jgi:hypothetical protein
MTIIEPSYADLIQKLTTLPLHLQKEVIDFVEFLHYKMQQQHSLPKSVKKPTFGYAKGFFTMSDDFDEPLEDFKEYME